MDFDLSQDEYISQRLEEEDVQWPYWKYGYNSRSVQKELWEEYNTVTIKISVSDLESFLTDVKEIAYLTDLKEIAEKELAKSEFCSSLATRSAKRKIELMAGLTGASCSIVGCDALLPGNDVQAKANFEQLSRHKSIESALKFLTNHSSSRSSESSLKLMPACDPQSLPSPASPEAHNQSSSPPNSIAGLKRKRRNSSVGEAASSCDDDVAQGVYGCNRGQQHKRRREAFCDRSNCVTIKQNDESMTAPHPLNSSDNTLLKSDEARTTCTTQCAVQAEARDIESNIHVIPGQGDKASIPNMSISSLDGRTLSQDRDDQSILEGATMTARSIRAAGNVKDAQQASYEHNDDVQGDGTQKQRDEKG